MACSDAGPTELFVTPGGTWRLSDVPSTAAFVPSPAGDRAPRSSWLGICGCYSLSIVRRDGTAMWLGTRHLADTPVWLAG